jgi:hypothetical protein
VTHHGTGRLVIDGHSTNSASSPYSAMPKQRSFQFEGLEAGGDAESLLSASLSEGSLSPALHSASSSIQDYVVNKDSPRRSQRLYLAHLRAQSQSREASRGKTTTASLRSDYTTGAVQTCPTYNPQVIICSLVKVNGVTSKPTAVLLLPAGRSHIEMC